MSEKLTQLKKRKNRIHEGMTFTEVLVATALLAFAMVPILHAMTRTQSYAVMIERKSKCLLYAQNRIEEVRAQAIEDYDSSWSESDLSLGDGYYCTITADSDPDLRAVTVMTGFDEDQDFHLDTEEILMQLQTLIAKQQ